MRSKDIIKALEADGWIQVRQSGSHCHFRHPVKKGTVTVPHPKSEMAIGTLKSIEKAAELELRSQDC